MISFIFVLGMSIATIAVIMIRKKSKWLTIQLRHSNRWYPPHRYLFMPFYRKARKHFTFQHQARAAVMLLSGIVHVAVVLPVLYLFPGNVDYLIVLSLLFYPIVAVRMWFLGK